MSSRTEGKKFMTTAGLEGQTIGIIALGRIGGRIAEMIQVFRPQQVRYYSTHRHEDKEQSLGLVYSDMADVLQNSDIVFLCVPDEAGKSFFSHEQFKQMKEGALLVSFTHPDIVDADALFEVLQSGKVRAASDYPMDERFEVFPLSQWYSFGASNAAFTKEMTQYTSDEAVKKLLKLLAEGEE